jgi:hypothetical protein
LTKTIQPVAKGFVFTYPFLILNPLLARSRSSLPGSFPLIYYFSRQSTYLHISLLLFVITLPFPFYLTYAHLKTVYPD